MPVRDLAASQADRLIVIRSRLGSDGQVRIADLARELAVSEMTIRRDLDELEAEGVARRIRGGARAVGPETFEERHRHNARAKARIAQKLVTMLPDRGTVGFDASSTIHRLATQIEQARDLVVMTSGLDAFAVLTGVPGVEAVLTGGVREPRTGSLIGPVAERAVEALVFDLFVCSASAVDVETGPTEVTTAEASLKRRFARASAQVVLAVDHTKLGSRARARALAWDEIDVLVTDLDPSDERLRPFADVVELR
jgi:DeoR family fructose operon transcriptional repressor